MSSNTKGNLYLIPSLLGASMPGKVIPPENIILVSRIGFFIVEEIKSARRFLTVLGINLQEDPKEFMVFNEHSDKYDVSTYLKPAFDGKDIGILSEAGLPCVADPGSLIVKQAHLSGIRVIPLTGPSSIFLALMASGFNGQNFCFHGYLPVEKSERSRSLKDIERMARKDSSTHIFIETPYRNNQFLEVLLKVCGDNTWLCVALDLSCTNETIISKPISNWKSSKLIDINKRPAVFLISSGNEA